jgi:hypothetical protein
VTLNSLAKLSAGYIETDPLPNNPNPTRKLASGTAPSATLSDGGPEMVELLTTLLVIVCGVIVTLICLPIPRQFSLRGLLLMMTVVAITLSLAMYFGQGVMK